MEAIASDAVLIATGGCGQLWERTTNPSVATGDGLAMAVRAGASSRDMAFFQFHPTALMSENKKPFLITEALRVKEEFCLITLESKTIEHLT